MFTDLIQNKYVIKYVLIIIICGICALFLLYFHHELVQEYRLFMNTDNTQAQVEKAIKIYQWILVISSLILPLFIIGIIIMIYDIKTLISELNRLTTQLYTSDIEYIDEHFKNIQLRNIVNAWNKNVEGISMEKNTQNEFIHNTVHDFKMPMQILKANVDLFKKKYGDNEYISAINNEIDSLNTEIERTLIIEKISFFEQPIFELRNLNDDLIMIVSKYDGIAFKIDIVGKCEQKIKYDYNCLSKIINNLIENAYKYSVDQTLEIKVEDNCLYLCNNTAHEIGDIFNMSRESLNPNGNGLGTQIINKYIELLGWKITSLTCNSQFIVKIEIL